MEKNNDLPKDLSKLDDAQLRSLINEIGKAAGAEKQMLELLTGDLDRVRKAVSGLSAEDAKKLIESAGADKAARICDALRKGGVRWT